MKASGKRGSSGVYVSDNVEQHFETDIHRYIHTHIYVYVCMYVYICVCVCVCVCVFFQSCDQLDEGLLG